MKTADLRDEISADYTDYVSGSDVLSKDQDAQPANTGFFAGPYCAASNRNLPNLPIFLSFLSSISGSLYKP